MDIDDKNYARMANSASECEVSKQSDSDEEVRWDYSRCVGNMNDGHWQSKTGESRTLFHVNLT